ncbi:restriction endonuclease subunit S, partial [Clostridium perfringens]
MKLKDIFEKPISGEWGKEVGEGEKGSKVIRTTNFTNIGRLDLSSIVERDIDSIKHENKKLKFGDIIIEKSGG